MGLFGGCGPVFVKESSDASEFIEKMQMLSEKATGSVKKDIDEQIKLASYGAQGENNIAFELKNSGIDMFILHDIYLEYEDLSAQIDFLVITKKHNYVIECKNLIGNIEIDSNGNFVRNYELFGKKIREGIYSPLTQNDRHLNVIKEIRKSVKPLLLRPLFEKAFPDSYKSIVCLANSKTILNDRYAKKEVKNKVIRADQLIKHIKEIDAKEGMSSSEKEMRELAEFFLNVSKPNKSDYTKKYEEMVDKVNKINMKDEAKAEAKPEVKSEAKVVKKEASNSKQDRLCPRCGNQLVLRTSKKGEHVGSQFYGCSSFPKCKYIENVVE